MTRGATKSYATQQSIAQCTRWHCFVLPAAACLADVASSISVCSTYKSMQIVDSRHHTVDVAPQTEWRTNKSSSFMRTQTISTSQRRHRESLQRQQRFTERRSNERSSERRSQLVNDCLNAVHFFIRFYFRERERKGPFTGKLWTRTERRSFFRKCINLWTYDQAIQFSVKMWLILFEVKGQFGQKGNVTALCIHDQGKEFVVAPRAC